MRGSGPVFSRNRHIFHHYNEHDFLIGFNIGGKIKGTFVSFDDNETGDAIRFFDNLIGTEKMNRDRNKDYFIIPRDTIRPQIYHEYNLHLFFDLHDNFHLLGRILKNFIKGRNEENMGDNDFIIALINAKMKSVVGKSADIVLQKIINSRGPSRRKGPSIADLNRTRTSLRPTILNWEEASKLFKKEEMMSQNLGKVIQSPKKQPFHSIDLTAMIRDRKKNHLQTQTQTQTKGGMFKRERNRNRNRNRSKKTRKK